MRARFLLTVLGIVCLTSLRAQDKPQDKFLTAHSFHEKIPVSCDYLLFLPRDYKAQTGRRWPLLLFLHGAGERGTNVWRADIHGPSKYIATHPDFPFVMLAPLCASNQVWPADALNGLLDETVRKYRIDTNRVYLTGLSMGGFGTWDLALARPERFAAVIPIAGGGSDLPVLLARTGFASPQNVQALKSLAFWVFHGGRDTVVDPGESQRMVAALRQLGVSEVKLTIYPEATHNSWAQTYDNPEVYDWLLQHRR